VRISPIVERLSEPENGFDTLEQDRKTVFRENVVMMYHWLSVQSQEIVPPMDD